MLVELLLFSSVVLSCICNGNAGVTSAFVRNEWPSIDISLDDQVIALPKDYNAPQQVISGFPYLLHNFSKHKDIPTK